MLYLTTDGTLDWMKYGNIEYFVYVTVNIQRIYYSRMEGP